MRRASPSAPADTPTPAPATALCPTAIGMGRAIATRDGGAPRATVCFAPSIHPSVDHPLRCAVPNRAMCCGVQSNARAVRPTPAMATARAFRTARVSARMCGWYALTATAHHRTTTHHYHHCNPLSHPFTYFIHVPWHDRAQRVSTAAFAPATNARAMPTGNHSPCPPSRLPLLLVLVQPLVGCGVVRYWGQNCSIPCAGGGPTAACSGRAAPPNTCDAESGACYCAAGYFGATCGGVCPGNTPDPSKPAPALLPCAGHGLCSANGDCYCNNGYTLISLPLSLCLSLSLSLDRSF